MQTYIALLKFIIIYGLFTHVYTNMGMGGTNKGVQINLIYAYLQNQSSYSEI